MINPRRTYEPDHLDPEVLFEDGKLVFTKETEKDLLLLLNEDLWIGGFSGEYYSATRKARRKLSVSDQAQ